VREHEYAERALRQRLPGLGIEALDDDVVLGEMDPRLGLAFGREGRPDLGQAVVVEGVDPEAHLELCPRRRVLRAGFAAEAPEPKRQARRIDAALAERLRDVEGVARGGQQHRRTRRAEELDLPRGRRRRPRRDDEAADSRSAVVHAQPRDPEAVRERVLDHVARPDAELPERARGHARDRLDVAGGPDRVHGLSGRAGGGVHLTEVGSATAKLP